VALHNLASVQTAPSALTCYRHPYPAPQLYPLSDYIDFDIFQGLLPRSFLPTFSNIPHSFSSTPKEVHTAVPSS